MNILDNFLSNVEEIYINNKKVIGDLDFLRFTKLKKIYCSNNQITSLINLPKTLVQIICINNNINKLDITKEHNKLSVLYCDNNNIQYFDNLPNSLYSLSCSSNNVTTLDMLPSNLKILLCKNNNFIKLDNLPLELYELYLIKASGKKFSISDSLIKTILPLFLGVFT